MLGAPIRHEWHNIESSIEDKGTSGRATISFKVYGSEKSGVVHVEAVKTAKDWLFNDLWLTAEGEKERIALIQNGLDVSSSR